MAVHDSVSVSSGFLCGSWRLYYTTISYLGFSYVFLYCRFLVVFFPTGYVLPMPLLLYHGLGP